MRPIPAQSGRSRMSLTRWSGDSPCTRSAAMRTAAVQHSSREPLAHQEALVPPRMVVDRRDDLEAVSLVERRGLERERHQHDLGAAAAVRLALGRAEELGTQPLTSPPLLHPELAHLARAAPGIAADAGDDAVALVANEDREPLAAADPGDARVELVKAIFQVLNVVRSRLGRRQVHGVSPEGL